MMLASNDFRTTMRSQFCDMIHGTTRRFTTHSTYHHVRLRDGWVKCLPVLSTGRQKTRISRCGYCCSTTVCYFLLLVGLQGLAPDSLPHPLVLGIFGGASQSKTTASFVC